MPRQKLIGNAVEYLEAHLHERDAIRCAARCAGVSQFHFYRIFQATLGITPGEFIRQRKLTDAALTLLNSRSSVLSIALDYGFESHEAFTRAFKTMFHLTPSAFRKQKQRVFSLERLPYRKETIMSISNSISKEPKFVKLEVLTVVGIEGRSSMSNNRIPMIWDAFLPRECEIKNRINPDISYGFCMMDEDADPEQSGDDTEFTALSCVAVSSAKEIPDGMVSRTFPAAEYAVFTHRGRFFPDGLPKSYGYIFGEWMPKSGYKATGTYDIERYDNRFKGTDHDDTEIDIYVPIVKK